MSDVQTHSLPIWAKRLGLRAHVLTLYEDLGDFGVTGAESTVDFKTVCIVEEGATQREENFLWKQKGRVTRTSIGWTGCSCIQGVYFWATLN